MSDEHEPRWRGTGYGGGRMVCRCGDDCEDGYNAHVEPIVADRIERAMLHTDPVRIGWTSQDSKAAFLDGETALANRIRAALRGDA